MAIQRQIAAKTPRAPLTPTTTARTRRGPSTIPAIAATPIRGGYSNSQIGFVSPLRQGQENLSARLKSFIFKTLQKRHQPRHAPPRHILEANLIASLPPIRWHKKTAAGAL
jgi:hypothetical protein